MKKGEKGMDRKPRTQTPVLKVKLLSKDAKLPTRGTPGSSGLDLSSVDNVTIRPGDIVMVHTGVALEIPKGNYGLLVVRSSLGKRGIRMATGASIIDQDYRNEVMVCLINDGIYETYIGQGERIAQIVIQPYTKTTVVRVEELSETSRGQGGFGSTGK